jgi:DNA-binding LacI/PurR family transcriptional regulator
MGDIAAHLGVSRQLVSLALRNAPGASARTKERVRETAEALGYRPHIGARALRQATSRHLGVAFTPTNVPEMDIVECIYDAAAAYDYHVVLSAQTPTRSTEQAVEELLGYRCAALLVFGQVVDEAPMVRLARSAPVPLVNVGAGRQNRHYDVVRSAGDAGIGEMVRHLARLGHRTIAYVNPENIQPAPLRLQGYLTAMADLGLRDRVVTVRGDLIEECGAAAARQLLAARGTPTAVVAANDQAAIGLLLELCRAGVKVPEEISVTGYDDIRLAGLSSTALTTMRQEPYEMGHNAVKAALRRIERPTVRPREFVITPTLVVRESTAPYRRGRPSSTLRAAGIPRSR